MKNILLLMLLICKIGFQSYSQSFELINVGSPHTCIMQTFYFDVENRAKVRIRDSSMIGIEFYLWADSIKIIHSGDHFILSPWVEDGNCYIYIMSADSHKKIDSVAVNIHKSPFLFYIDRGGWHESAFYANYKLSKLRVKDQNAACFDHAKGYNIESYLLCLIRGDSVIVTKKMRGQDRVPDRFSSVLYSKGHPGDRLEARNIIMKKKENPKIRMEKYVLMVIH